MKRLLVFILALIYLVTTTGATMHMHFCMGKLANWSLWSKDHGPTCGKCGMEKTEQSNGCCSDEAKWVKIEDEQKAAVAAYDFSPILDAEPVHFPGFEHQTFFLESADLLPQSHAPPDFSSIAIYKRNCVFRI